MSRRFEYAVIQLADVSRNERLNAALAIFSDQGLELRIPRRLEKLRALSSALDVDGVRTAISQLEDFDKELLDQGCTDIGDRIKALGALSPFKLSSPSYFVAPTQAIYEESIARLTKALIDPEPARLRPVFKRTKLLTLMKSAFRSERVLAKRGEDISAHRLVSNVVIAEGLNADFVLKNGAMHVIETVDASSDDLSVRKVVADIAVAALVLEQARMKFGENSTESRLVYDASVEAERVAMPSLEAAAHQGTRLINWASANDRNTLIDQLSSLAVPYDVKKSAKVEIHASTQHRFKLN
ncbi:MAG: hypothetical protein B7Y43_11085 [Sphingomonas sp. 28-62-20]|uniref:hypothetical protein n=1 Tax=Sphingomonas sp. 28-62-20 TaxID=1970433 RepID=UPI000BD9A4F1|nr:MAG: hypothetical protein B7Y43_11085 [Sphingomonas sp. 28-62-20]